MRYRNRRILQKGRGLSSILRVIGKSVGSAVKAAAPVVKRAGRVALQSKTGRKVGRQILSAAIDVAGGKSVGKSSTKLKNDLVKIARATTLNNGKKKKKKVGSRSRRKTKKRKKSTIFD